MRRPSGLRSVSVQRSNGCGLGMITGCRQPSHAGVAFLFWKTMQIEYLRSLPSSRTEP